MITEITKILNSFSSKWACLLSNGTIVETSLKDENLNKIKILRILKKIIPQTNVGSIVFFSDLLIYRPSDNLFIFLIGRYPKTTIKEKLTEISKKYKDLNKHFKKEKDKVKIKLVLFSMTLEDGPEPIYYYPHDFEQILITKITMKSMLTLSTENNGASKDMISFLPFVDINSLAIVYTFQIENKMSRGNAIDCAITILFDYKFRALIYEKYELLEKALKELKKQLINEFNTTKEYQNIFQLVIKKYFHKISFEAIESVDLKDEMMEEIKKLAKL